MVYLSSPFWMVISLELVNTAVEAVVDLVTEERKPLAKIAKDTAAGAVLFYGNHGCDHRVYHIYTSFYEDCGNCIAMEQSGYISEWQNLLLTLTSFYFDY
mgnify:CR=1 FL=1